MFWWFTFLVACGQTQQQAAALTSVAVPTTAVPTNVPPAETQSGPTAIPTPGANEFANPVIDKDFPDPDLLKVGDTYYAYATNSGGVNVQMASSSDLVNWQLLSDAMPALALWVQPGYTWAPEVTAVDGGYVLYFTARDTASQRQCIGAATSSAPEGPFTSASDKPLICQTDLGGSIDASSFSDGDKRYVLWKNDGNCCGQDTWLYIQQVSADGLTLQGEPTQLVKQDQGWEGLLVEAPTLWKHDNTYVLLYSANNYAGADYAVGYATASQVLGPYTKGDGPLLKTKPEEGVAAIGPGGQDVVVDKDGETWLAYHSWDPTITYRRVQLDELVWEGDRPVVKGPDVVPQAVP